MGDGIKGHTQVEEEKDGKRPESAATRRSLVIFKSGFCSVMGAETRVGGNFVKDVGEEG